MWNSETSMTVIAICGLGHSGSTILERCIASQKDCVGLGEVDRTLQQARDQGIDSFKPCTCGQIAEYCKVWSIISKGVQDDEEWLVRTLRQALYASCRNVIVESSKRVSQAFMYQRLQERGLVKVVPVLLIRDYRSWVTSQKVSRRDWGLAIIPYIVRSWFWMYRNEKVRRALCAEGLNPSFIRYEDFIRNPKQWLAPIFARAGVKTEEINPVESCQHALKGNSMRYDPERNSTILIDEKWKKDWRTRYLLPFVVGPALYNAWIRRSARRQCARDRSFNI